MAYLIACLTAVLSFLVNRYLLKKVGKSAVVSWGPLAEEIAKSLPAYWFSADILLTHLLFGVIEGFVDWVYNHRHGYLSATLSVLGHAVFGAVTVSLLIMTGSIWFGLLGGVTVHLLWNGVVVWLS